MGDAIRKRLDQETKILAAQDFRHTVQRESEKVADFIRRLERTFRIAYGRDSISKDTREAFLYGQLQEGLRIELMRSPSVSGARSYQELTLAARCEEQRQRELKKRQQYQSGVASSGKRPFSQEHKQAEVGSGKPTEKSENQNQGKKSLVCYTCGKTGHFAAKNCRRSESKGAAPKNSPGHHYSG